MGYLTPTISHGKRVPPYARGRRVHGGRLWDLARLPLWATTPKSGLPPTRTGLRIRGRHRTTWLAAVLLWYFFQLLILDLQYADTFRVCGGGVRHSTSPQTSILLLPPVVLTAFFFSYLSCSATASGWFRRRRWLRTVPRRHVVRVGKSRERLSF